MSLKSTGVDHSDRDKNYVLEVVRKKSADAEKRMNRQTIKVSYDQDRSRAPRISSPAADS